MKLSAVTKKLIANEMLTTKNYSHIYNNTYNETLHYGCTKEEARGAAENAVDNECLMKYYG
jgi:hypothetical protein